MRISQDVPSQEQCVALVRATLGMPERALQLVSAQPWMAASAVAQAYRHGRVLLVADASHQRAPFAGLGAATGIQDAHNLTRKLALVLRGRADASLLNSYEAELLPVARAAVLASARFGDERGLPRRDRSGLPADGWTLLGLDHVYRSRAIVSDDNDVGEDAGRPGRRLPTRGCARTAVR